MYFRRLLVLAVSFQLLGPYVTSREVRRRIPLNRYNKPESRASEWYAPQLTTFEGPTCYPRCTNNGVCVQENFCQCRNGFKGPLCQYDKDTCDIRKAGFNGNYECLVYTHKTTCKLWCPRDYKLSVPGRTIYDCDFTKNEFDMKIPTCLYPKGVTVKKYSTSSIGKPLPPWADSK